MEFGINLFKLVNFQINFETRVKVWSVLEVSAEPLAIKGDKVGLYELPMKGQLRQQYHFL